MAFPENAPFSKIPSWAALSLLMNGLLFVTLLAIWHDDQGSQPSVLPEAQAAADVEIDTAFFLPAVGEVRRLNYQQWVRLLQHEMDAMVAKNPDHLTILLGDSLSLWFPTELLPGRRVWMNQGISGEQTDGVLARLGVLAEADVDTIFLMVGINDLIWGQSDAQIIQNYRAIMDALVRQHPDTQIVVQSILPHGAETATWESRERLLALPNSRIQAMNQSLEQVAADYDAKYLDLYALFSNGEGNLRPDLTTDGLHLNREGYLVWRAAIALYTQLEL
ncbi:MAG: GDSL-type esterase/lipase family protein [Cyanobacteria bacterium J06648_16]